jgi:hypothetical protein
MKFDAFDRQFQGTLCSDFRRNIYPNPADYKKVYCHQAKKFTKKSYICPK